MGLEYHGGGGGAVSSVAGKTGAITLVKGDVGLPNVDNTSDANKPVSTAQQTALDAKPAQLYTPAAATWHTLQPGQASSSGSWTLNTLLLFPAIMPATATYDSAQFNTTVASTATSVLRAGIYGATAAGLPDFTNLIKDFGEGSGKLTDDTAGAHTFTFSGGVSIPRGLVYLAFVPQTAAAGTFTTVNNFTIPSMPLPVVGAVAPTTSYYGYTRSSVSGALPTSGTPTAMSSASPIRFFLHTA